MKNIFPVLLVFALISCSSPEKLLQQENYDALIEKSVKKILKGKKTSENSELLDKAYTLANERDLERINYLKREGNPNTWDEVLSLYSRLKYRQETVKKVLPLRVNNRTINYEYVDYNSKIIEAKRNAAEYYYSHAKSLMNNKNKESYRQAYYEFQRAKNYSGGGYTDIDQLINDSKYLGTNRVLLSSFNNTHFDLPKDFMDNLISIHSTGLNNEWTEYHFRQVDKKMVYDYYIDVHLQVIQVLPGTINEVDHEYTKRVQDGFNYALDSRGNVMKDTAGNDIKIPKYKDLRCTLIEKIKEKSVMLKGEIEFSATNPDRIIAREPIAAKTQFQDISYRAIGDLEALDIEKRNQLQDKEIPFPDDISMIYNTSEALKNSILDVINNGRKYIK